jgi:hypothetical protein
LGAKACVELIMISFDIADSSYQDDVGLKIRATVLTSHLGKTFHKELIKERPVGTSSDIASKSGFFLPVF